MAESTRNRCFGNVVLHKTPGPSPSRWQTGGGDEDRLLCCSLPTLGLARRMTIVWARDRQTEWRRAKPLAGQNGFHPAARVGIKQQMAHATRTWRTTSNTETASAETATTESPGDWPAGDQARLDRPWARRFGISDCDGAQSAEYQHCTRLHWCPRNPRLSCADLRRPPLGRSVSLLLACWPRLVVLAAGPVWGLYGADGAYGARASFVTLSPRPMQSSLLFALSRARGGCRCRPFESTSHVCPARYRPSPSNRPPQQLLALGTAQPG